MSFGGRQRISQLSKEEWRAALEQQVQDKQRQRQTKQRQELGELHGTATISSSSNSDRDTGKAVDNVGEKRENEYPEQPETQQPDNNSYSMETLVDVRPGRRFVQQMSRDEWKQALEDQIRDKQRHRSAPGGDRSEMAPGSAKEVQQSGTQDNAAPVPARRRSSQLSREEYLKLLEEQITQKKQLDAEAKRLEAKRKLWDQDDAPAAPKSASDSMTPLVAEAKDDFVLNAVANAAQWSNQTDDELVCKPTEQASADSNEQATVTATDPTTLHKLFEFCEEMKRQNEEVKKQLVEQRSVLSDLRTSLAAAPDSKARPSASAPSLQRPLVKQINEVDTKSSILPRTRSYQGTTKIPLPACLTRRTGSFRVDFKETTPLIAAPVAPADSAVVTQTRVERPIERAEVAPKKATDDKALALPAESSNGNDRRAVCAVLTRAESKDADGCLSPQAVRDAKSEPLFGLSVEAEREAFKDDNEEENEEECELPSDSCGQLQDWSVAVAVASFESELDGCSSALWFDGSSTFVSLDLTVADVFDHHH